MSSSQKNKCHMIIHTAAAAAAAVSAVPIPGTGVAADLGALSGMVIGLSEVFDCSLEEMVILLGKKIGMEAAKKASVKGLKEVAKIIAKEFIKEEGKKVAAAEFVKYVPGLGNAAAAALSVASIENMGWKLADELYETHTNVFRKIWNWVQG